MSRLLHTCPLATLLVLSACVDISFTTDTDAASTTDVDVTDGASGSGDLDTTGVLAPTSGQPDTTTTADTTPQDPTTGSPDLTTTDASATTATTAADTESTTTGETGDTGDTDDTGDDTTTGAAGEGGEIPAPSAACPDIVDGLVDFKPAGLDPRPVRVWVDPDIAAEKDGPLYFFWYGTNGSPEQAIAGLSDIGIQEILDAGGIVVAPTHDPAAGVFPWYLVLGQQQDDLQLADDILACADQQFGVDRARIHSLGFSAGALHTAQMSIRRAAYLASVTLYSGGLIFNSMPMYDDPDNDLPAMIFHGGTNDVVVVGFKQASADYAKYIGDNGSFSFTCDHGMGHTIPPEQDSVLQFFADHPWGATPEPYADALPAGFPDYCVLP